MSLSHYLQNVKQLSVSGQSREKSAALESELREQYKALNSTLATYNIDNNVSTQKSNRVSTSAIRSNKNFRTYRDQASDDLEETSNYSLALRRLSKKTIDITKAPTRTKVNFALKPSRLNLNTLCSPIKEKDCSIYEFPSGSTPLSPDLKTEAPPNTSETTTPAGPLLLLGAKQVDSELNDPTVATTPSQEDQLSGKFIEQVKEHLTPYVKKEQLDLYFEEQANLEELNRFYKAGNPFTAIANFVKDSLAYFKGPENPKQ